MKLSLEMVFKTVPELREALKILSEDYYDACYSGMIGNVSYICDFTESNDLFSDDADYKPVRPEDDYSGWDRETCGIRKIEGKCVCGKITHGSISCNVSVVETLTVMCGCGEIVNLEIQKWNQSCD